MEGWVWEKVIDRKQGSTLLIFEDYTHSNLLSASQWNLLQNFKGVDIEYQRYEVFLQRYQYLVQ